MASRRHLPRLVSLLAPPMLRAATSATERWRLEPPTRRGGRRRVRRRRRSHFQVLIFHRVHDPRRTALGGMPECRFDSLMELLARGWRIEPLQDLIDLAALDRIPDRALAITFDDGYRDNFEEAFPVLRRLGVPATIFLATGAIGSGQRLWHDRVFDAFATASPGSIRVDGIPVPLETPMERRGSLLAFLQRAKALAPSARDAVIDATLGDMGRHPAEREMLTWDEVRAMSRSCVSFGAHTVSHPILSRIPSEEARGEIVDSKIRIEQETGMPVRLFAYPNGGPGDFTSDAVRIVQDAGFSGAVSTIRGSNDSETNRFALHRVSVWGPEPIRCALQLAWERLNS